MCIRDSRREGESYVCRGVPQHTDALADENLVDDVIKCAYEHGNDTWDCKFYQ